MPARGGCQSQIKGFTTLIIESRLEPVVKGRRPTRWARTLRHKADALYSVPGMLFWHLPLKGTTRTMAAGGAVRVQPDIQESLSAAERRPVPRRVHSREIRGRLHQRCGTHVGRTVHQRVHMPYIEL